MTISVKKALYVVIAVVLISATVAITTAFAKGQHLKATGDVEWTSGPGVEGYRTEFSVHQGAPGKNSERGTATLYHPAGGSRVMDVGCVLIDGDEAWFAGEVTEADGAFAGQVGEKVIFWVKDNGQPGSDPADEIGATKQFSNPCGKLGKWYGGGTVTGGNLKVHSQ